MARLSWSSLRFLFIWQIPAALALISFRLVILFVPFRFIVCYSGVHYRSAALLLLPTKRQHIAKARHTRKVIETAQRRLPLEVNCFPQALLAIFLLRFRKVPYSLFFGVRRASGEFKAHAWVSCGHITVCGEKGSSDFTIISTYTYEPDSPISTALI